MTAFQAIPGSSDSLRPPSRTEPYTNFRDTTDYYVKVIEKIASYGSARKAGGVLPVLLDAINANIVN